MRSKKKKKRRRRSVLLTVPCECGIKRALPVCVWIIKAVQGADVGIGGGTGGGAACELDESKPLSAMYVFVLVELLSLVSRIELRVAVLIWLSSIVWSTGIIGAEVFGNNNDDDGGGRSGDKAFDSIAEWLPEIRGGRKTFIKIHINCSIAWKSKDLLYSSQHNVSQLSFSQFDDQTMTGHT